MVLQQKPKTIKLSIDLSEENYEALINLKQQSHTSIGKIINMVLSENLKNTLVEKEGK